jgi:hypothetical protein
MRRYTSGRCFGRQKQIPRARRRSTAGRRSYAPPVHLRRQNRNRPRRVAFRPGSRRLRAPVPNALPSLDRACRRRTRHGRSGCRNPRRCAGRRDSRRRRLPAPRAPGKFFLIDPRPRATGRPARRSRHRRCAGHPGSRSHSGRVLRNSARDRETRLHSTIAPCHRGSRRQPVVRRDSSGSTSPGLCVRSEFAQAQECRPHRCEHSPLRQTRRAFHRGSRPLPRCCRAESR